MLPSDSTVYILFFLFLVSVFSFFSLAPWAPTNGVDLARIHAIIKLKKGQRLLEMGCGNGGVALYIAKHNPTAHIVGIELSPLLYAVSKLRAWMSRLENIEIIYGNALKVKLEKYDVIYIFGLPQTITEKVAPLLKKTNTHIRLISYSFRMGDADFEEIRHAHENQSNIYEYILKK